MVYVCGHRGAAGVMPENTLQGFRYAIDLGVQSVECDVHLTRDQKLIVMHDERVDRTTNGSGFIRELDFNTIRTLDAGDGEQVPTLEEVLETVQGRVKLLCELKGAGVEDAAVDTVVSCRMESEVIFTSFDLEKLTRVKGQGDHLQTGAIFSNPSEEDIARAIALGVSGIGIYYRNLCLRMVEQVLQAELELRAWNPDTLPEQKMMMAFGVTGISTNRPDILLDYLKSQSQSQPQR